MVMKNNLIGKFNCNKNGMKIKVLNYPRNSVKIRQTKKMVKDQIKVFPSESHSKVKMMKEARSQIKTPPIKIHCQIRMMRNNQDKVHFERGKVEKNENRVYKYKWDLVNNYKDVRMISR